MDKIKSVNTNDKSTEKLELQRHPSELNHSSDSCYYCMLQLKWLAAADEIPKILKDINKNGISANNAKY